MRALAAGWLTFVALACGPGVRLTPSTGPITGHFEVQAQSAHFKSLVPPLKVEVGGVLAYGLVRDDPQTLRFTVQGVPDAGTVPVVITDRHGLTEQASLSFTGPLDPRFDRMVAMGASLTMGVQTSSINLHSQTHGPALQLARAAQAYLSLPLVKPDYLPEVTLADFDPATCQLVNGPLGTLLQSRAQNLVNKISDSSGAIHMDWIRVDPRVEVRNVAIGGFRVAQDLSGGGGLFPLVFEHVIWDPFAGQTALFSDPVEKMIDRVVAMRPTLVVSTDLIINDLDNVNLGVPGIPDLSALTPLSQVQASLDALMTRLDATGAELFFADVPDITLLKAYQDKVAQLLAAGHSQAEATGWLAGIQQRGRDYNAALNAEVAQHPKLHVVPVNARVADLLARGIQVGPVTLSPKNFGGLFSADNLHFSDTTYGYLANEFALSINAALGTHLPPVDLAPVLAQDPYSVANLRSAGFTCAGQ